MDGVSRDEFVVDELRQAGACKCVEAIGEAAGEILRRFRGFAIAYPELELAAAYRTRNRLSHGYDTFDRQTLWDTYYVPRLVADIGQLLTDSHG
ncbi:DUF86 domain-containing protein [Nitratireductor mangrovi]|uniref:DUF86 domain-containing protein n=1 Tax=Nitratireductor mangrovi TaxID=2599600 RepID=A0A5B8KU70_9HYPH|nr:DUF86 domain-containing protein [Nitratireductor mangrovi]